MTLPTHLAAITNAKSQPFTLEHRPTPKPGPGELLIDVKSIALNPADGLMRDHGLFIPSYPTVIGFDMSGVVLEVGEDVPVDPTSTTTTTSTESTDENERDDPGGGGPFFKPGITRIAAYAASVWKSCHPDYGAFQEKCLVPWQHAISIPDERISWNQAASLSVAVQVPLNAWDVLGIPRLGEFTSSSSSVTSAGPVDSRTSRKEKNQALLIWGASSSIGTMGVQTARILRDDPNSSFSAVYATSGATNQKYVSSLGADRVFDYKDPRVVEKIVSGAGEDGVVIRCCFLATGDVGKCRGVLGVFGNDQGGEEQKGKIASAPPIPPDVEEVDGVEIIFLTPSMDERERLTQFRYWLGIWGTAMLGNGSIRPSPEVRVVGRGLGAVNSGVDELLRGVSCTKLVVEVAQ